MDPRVRHRESVASTRGRSPGRSAGALSRPWQSTARVVRAGANGCPVRYAVAAWVCTQVSGWRERVLTFGALLWRLGTADGAASGRGPIRAFRCGGIVLHAIRSPRDLAVKSVAPVRFDVGRRTMFCGGLVVRTQSGVGSYDSSGRQPKRRRCEEDHSGPGLRLGRTVLHRGAVAGKIGARRPRCRGGRHRYRVRSGWHVRDYGYYCLGSRRHDA